ncbi:MAG: WD40 repeat domain-containing protein [Bosea sp. (in: a-proteobacteria)]
MTAPSPSAPSAPVSLIEHVAAFEADGHVLGLAFAGAKGSETLMGARADGVVFSAGPDGVITQEAHPGAGITALDTTREGVLTGGDDGRVVWTAPGKEPQELAKDAKRRWINAVSRAPSTKGEISFCAGKDVTFRDAKGKLVTTTLPASGEGLAFAPKGLRLAIATYNGASLWYPETEVAPEFLEWKGSHIGVIWSPDARFIVTTMQENSLHGWRLAVAGTKAGHMRMTGYVAKPRSLSWSHDGQWLATSGADAAIIWPFQGDGPMGKAPRECGIRRAKVAQVAFHPGGYVLGAGYEDGCILLLRLTDGAELLVRPR